MTWRKIVVFEHCALLSCSPRKLKNLANVRRVVEGHQRLEGNNSLYFNSVRDLLRALRNKKHHYNELPEVTKLMYGRIPDQFTDYWTSRFPKLLIHSWMAMHCIKNEPSFAKYFDKDYDFVKV